MADDKTAQLVPDVSGHAPGRGAHLHPTRACLELAERRRAFSRALRAEGSVGLDALRRYVDQREAELGAAPASQGVGPERDGSPRKTQLRPRPQDRQHAKTGTTFRSGGAMTQESGSSGS